jgi:hypothetical protein
MLPGLAIALIVFLVAISHKETSPPQQELPAPASQPVGLGLPEPTSARLHIGEYLQVQHTAAPDDRFGTVISQSDDRPVLEVASGAGTPPLLRAVSQGSVVVTVLLEPRCPPEGICREYRRDLGAVRVTVLP